MIPPDWKCPRRIGFLFPHACERTTPVGCPDCQNAQIADPYGQRVDRYTYTDYDTYDESAAIFNFTEADGEMLVKPREEFEDDMSAS
jgi:hypothetical protein